RLHRRRRDDSPPEECDGQSEQTITTAHSRSPFVSMVVERLSSAAGSRGSWRNDARNRTSRSRSAAANCSAWLGFHSTTDPFCLLFVFFILFAISFGLNCVHRPWMGSVLHQSMPIAICDSGEFSIHRDCDEDRGIAVK